MAYSFPIDPEEVLGLSHGASLEEIRQAYREKAKRHHPDTGGESWAFRIVNQSHEWLMMQRVTHRLREEEAREEARTQRPAPKKPNPDSHSRQSSASEDDTAARRALRDTVNDPSHLVDIEFFTIRYAVADPAELLYSRAEDRTLTCSLNITWPSREHPELSSRHILAGTAIQSAISIALKATLKKTRAKTSHVHQSVDEFSAWVSFPTQTMASAAFDALRINLHEQRLGVAQWMRDVIIPRTSR